MRSNALRLLTAVLVVACVCAGVSSAQTVKAPKQKKALPAATQQAAPQQPSAATDSMMAQMTRIGTPGPQHQALQAMEGTWKASAKTYGPTGEASVSEGTSENHMILGGRYLEQRFTSTMMNQPFTGYGLTGYDNAAQKYVFVWVDNSSTSILSGTGTMDDASRTLTLTGTTPGPDGKPMDVRMVTKIVDANTHTFSMYGPIGSNPDALVMEITYTKQ
ncbi:MAG TPA: DUF1579 domain-containing protein [Terriglobales bacterium]|nr:DUF1579 domain-containing protein [Terriglobales bacterium]